MAALLGRLVETAAAQQIGLRWRLSNKEIERIAWLVEHRESLAGARSAPWSRLQPILLHEGAEDLLALCAASAVDSAEAAADVADCRRRLDRPREVLDPPPLATGDDLVAAGIRPGPRFKTLLQRLRDAQLDGEIHTKEEALALARTMLSPDAGH
jgi:hypothetical protein